MWGEETGAETMTLNPWAGVSQQPQVWQNMNSRGNGNPSVANSVGSFAPNGGSVRPGSQQWDGGATPAGRSAWNPNPHAPRWTPSVNHGNASGWPNAQQHWSVANSNGTYAEQTKKNMALGRSSGPNLNMSQRFDGSQGWGSKVDQGTPWDTGNSGGVSQQMHEGKEQWSNPTRWTQPPGTWPTPIVAPMVADWQQGQPRHDHWANHPTGGMVPSGGAWAQQALGVASSSEQGRVPYDPNPQTPGPWVAPQPAEMNNDMMWHDPNPKQKKIQKDVGTGIWGDPTSQIEIRRWKDLEAEGGEFLGGSDWGSGSNSSTQPTGWGDVGPAQGNDGTDRWGAQGQALQGGWSDKVDQDRDLNGGKSDLNQIQRGIQNAIANGALCPDGQSRLQQWKKQRGGIGVGSPEEKMGVASSSDSNVPSLIAATKIMNIHGDWTPPSSVADDSAKSEDQVSSSGTNNEKESSVKESASPTPPPTQLDDGPQEFVPGKKWEWRDPNKVAEDPNATPGNCKPNPLMAAGNNMNFAFSNSAVNTANPYGPEVPSGNASTFWPNNSQGFNVPYGRDMYNSVRARLPSNGQFMPQRGMSGGYSNSNHNRMQTPPGKGVFIVLNHQGANETQLNFSCTRAGQLLNVASLGGQTVLLRYADSSSEGVLQKLKADFPGNERIKTVSEEEVEKLLKNRSPTMSGSAWAPNSDTPLWSNGGSPLATGEIMSSQNVFSNQEDLNRQQY